MEGKNKNILIGTLLAVVFVMAVGYAAFAQQLTINGTATINSSWDVHFDQTKTTGSGVIDASKLSLEEHYQLVKFLMVDLMKLHFQLL